MRSAAGRRLPTAFIILLALIGIAASVLVGRAIAPGADETSTINICMDIYTPPATLFWSLSAPVPS
jgi:hypothetical protein